MAPPTDPRISRRTRSSKRRRYQYAKIRRIRDVGLFAVNHIRRIPNEIEHAQASNELFGARPTPISTISHGHEETTMAITRPT